MNNSKEVVILIIMILVVLVSAAKAEEAYLNVNTEYIPAATTVDKDGLEMEPFDITEACVTDGQSALQVGVTSTSSLSNVDDDYGLVLTLKTLF